MTIGEKIYNIRTSLNMSLRDFANETGVTHTTIARLESLSDGPKKVYLDTIYQICKRINYDFGLFLSETGYLPKAHNFDEVSRYSTEEMKLINDYRLLSSPCKNLVKDTVSQLLIASSDSAKSKKYS